MIESKITDKKLIYNIVELGGESINDNVGLVITCVGVYQFEKPVSRNGQSESLMTVTGLVAEDGQIYTTASPTFSRSMESMCEIFGQPEPDNPVQIEFTARKGKNGNGFLQAKIV